MDAFLNLARSTICRLALILILAGGWAAAERPASAADGVEVSYRLPLDGPLPRTYRVTLAITDPRDPNWIVSTFVAGAPRTVTAENEGRFTERWDGLDDNFLPVPPGGYGVKGIFMPARRWDVTGEYHSFIPKFAVGAGDSWMPTPAEDRRDPWMRGFGAGTMADIAILDGGRAALYHNYFEGADNPLLIDLEKPTGPDQIVGGYSPGGTGGGGVAVASDGEVIWAVSHGVKGPNFIYRPDRQRFGRDRALGRSDVHVVDSPVAALAAWRDRETGHRFVYAGGEDGIRVLDGDSAEELGRLAFGGIRSLVVSGQSLLALRHDERGRWTIYRTALGRGLPDGQWQAAAELAGAADPVDFKLDTGGYFYVSERTTNQLLKVAPSGEIVLKFGRGSEQRPGHYDDHVFMSPGKLAIWKDGAGRERLIVIERSGPGRISEWSTDGVLLRQWFPGVMQAVGGYAVDPEEPENVYMATSEPASGSGLVRFRVDYRTGAWRVDAVWPRVSSWTGFPGGLWFPRIINAGGRKYLAFARTHGPRDRYGYMIYRLDGDRWVPSAGLVPDPRSADRPGLGEAPYWWHDANGDGELQEEEFRDDPAHLPSRLRYFGERWLNDLSFLLIEENGRSVWRLAPSGFDAHGNPVYDGKNWTKLLTDPAFAARAAKTADALHGGNEIGDSFDQSWASIDGDLARGFYVNAYSGPPWRDGVDSTGRIGSQVKITRYVPDGARGFAALWRVGRKAFGIARPGEMYGTWLVTPPINHLFGVADGNGLYHLFTDDGLYADTLFYDAFRGDAAGGGMYNVGGELINGYAFLHPQSGRVYVGLSREAATFFEIEGWRGDRPAFRRIETLPERVSIVAGQFAPAAEAALRARGKSGGPKVAVFRPAPGGGPSLDGSTRGWEAADAAEFGPDAERRVEVRTLYDPETLYLRWHVRLPYPFVPRDLPRHDQIFTQATGADTVSLYFQADPSAPASGEARPGDTRIVFALAKDGDRATPLAVAFHPRWSGADARPATFASLVGVRGIEHVAELPREDLGYRLDPDGRGFVIAAAIHRSALPPAPVFSGTLRTTIDFEATFGGRTKVWWANVDGSAGTITSDEPAAAALYPGSWAQAQFVPLADALPVTAWLVSGPWGGEELRGRSPEILRDKPVIADTFDRLRYPPDSAEPDWRAAYKGPLSQDIGGMQNLVTWHVVRAEDDAKARLDRSARLYFAAAWIFVPDDMELDCSFLTERQNAARVTVDRAPVAHRTLGNPSYATWQVPEERQAIRFRKGWNRVYVRTYAIGYDLKLGMLLRAPPETLWKIRQSPLPPEAAAGPAAEPPRSR